MRSRYVIAGVLGVVLGMPALSQAGPQPERHPNGINSREHRQVERIKHGVKADEITRGELERLRADQSRLRAEEARYRASGQGLNSREFRDLQRDLDRTSREINRATHNDRAPGA